MRLSVLQTTDSYTIDSTWALIEIINQSSNNIHSGKWKKMPYTLSSADKETSKERTQK